MNNVTKIAATAPAIGHNASTIDRLGALKAQIADLEAMAKVFSDEIKKMGPGVHEGALFKANVSEIAETESFDAKDMEKKLREMGVTNNWFKHHIKVKAGYTRLVIQDR